MSHLRVLHEEKQSQKLDARKRNYSHVCTLIFFIAECHSKIMTQGFKMRCQPLFICPAPWPRYRCEREKQPFFQTLETSVGTAEKVFFHLHRRPVSTRKLNIQCLKGRWGEEKVISLTTKNHMHIHFCASNYKRAAGHWLALIIVPFVLSFMNDNLQKAKHGLCQGG